VRCHSLSWAGSLPDGPALLSLRPENIRVAGSSPIRDAVRFRGKLGHRAFHGATELLQIECTDGLKFSVRAAARTEWQGEIEFQFDPADAVPVRESAERA
jgi:hypothetical protein